MICRLFYVYLLNIYKYTIYIYILKPDHRKMCTQSMCTVRFFPKDLFYLGVHVFDYMQPHTYTVLTEANRGHQIQGPEVTSSCQSFHMGAGNQTPVLCKSSRKQSLLSHRSSPFTMSSKISNMPPRQHYSIHDPFHSLKANSLERKATTPMNSPLFYMYC